MTTATTKVNQALTASIILEQLGGRRFIAMTGAKNLVYDGDSLRFGIMRNSSGFNLVRVELTRMDVYDVTFMKFSLKTGITKEVKVTGIYADQLQQVLTAKTGLYTRL